MLILLCEECGRETGRALTLCRSCETRQLTEAKFGKYEPPRSIAESIRESVDWHDQAKRVWELVMSAPASTPEPVPAPDRSACMDCYRRMWGA